jgi:hypothetical protein
MKMLPETCPGSLAEICAKVKALGPDSFTENPRGIACERNEFKQLFLVEAVKIGNVSPGNNHDMRGTVWIFIQENVAG